MVDAKPNQRARKAAGSAGEELAGLLRAIFSDLRRPDCAFDRVACLVRLALGGVEHLTGAL